MKRAAASERRSKKKSTNESDREINGIATSDRKMERERNMGMERLERTGREKQGDGETIGMERRWGMGTGRGAGQRRPPERWRRAKRKAKVSWEGKSWRVSLST